MNQLLIIHLGGVTGVRITSFEEKNIFYSRVKFTLLLNYPSDKKVI